MANDLPTAKQVADMYNSGGGVIYVDRTEYMQGPGRFANPASIPAIQDFFNKTKLLTGGIPLGDGGRFFNKEELFSALGYSDASAPKIVTVDQKYFSDGNPDSGYRTFVWGNTAFKISEDAKFIIEADGRRRIENFSLGKR